jgi:hypothetical protein
MIPKEDLLINPKNLYNKIKEIIDKYRDDLEIKDIFYYKYLLDEIKNTSFWNIHISSNRICMHVYKKGKREGDICGKKVFIKTENKLQKFLCSRHCRDYKSKNRVYDYLHKRCSYERKNGEICKHICKNNNKFCYIHKKEEHIELLEFAPIKLNNSNIEKKLYFKKLEKRRKKYFSKKNKKYKHYINNDIIIKINKNLQNTNFSDFYNHNNYKYYNYYFKDIT